jgi:hypothetical protein
MDNKCCRNAVLQLKNVTTKDQEIRRGLERNSKCFRKGSYLVGIISPKNYVRSLTPAHRLAGIPLGRDRHGVP